MSDSDIPDGPMGGAKEERLSSSAKFPCLLSPCSKNSNMSEGGGVCTEKFHLKEKDFALVCAAKMC